MATSILADMLTWFRPAITTEYVTQRGVTNSTAGFIGTVELVTLAVTIMVWTRYAPVVRFRTVALVGVALTAITALASMTVAGLYALVATRVVAGIGFGLLMFVPIALAARFADAQSAYGRIFAVSMACNAAILSLLPWIGAMLNRSPAFPAFGIFAIALLPIVLIMPSDVRYTGGQRNESSPLSSSSGRCILLLAAAYASLAVGYLAVWTFFDLLADRSGLTSEQATRLTAVMAVCSIVGSLCSAPLGRVIGMDRTTIFVTILLLLSLEFLIYAAHPAAFALVGCLMILFWFMMFPAILGWAATIDPDGRGSAVVGATGLLVGAAGSYVGGLAIDLGGYVALGVVAAITLIVALSLFGAAAGATGTLNRHDTRALD